MKKELFALALVLAITLVSCSSEKEEEKDEEKTEQKKETVTLKQKAPPSQEELAKMIAAKEAVLFDEKKQAKKDIANEMIVLYQDYATYYPDADDAAEMMFRCSDVARSINRHNISLQMLQKIIDHHKDYDKYVHALYFKAFFLDNVFHKKEEAKAAYFQVVQEFPNHQYAEDSKSRLATIDLSDKEMIKMFKEKNKGNTSE